MKVNGQNDPVDCIIGGREGNGPSPAVRGRTVMQPRGQLWFELQRICQDFRAYSGLTDKEAVEVLVVVLNNLLGEQQEELEKLKGALPLP
jgi:hypothetical protein